MRPLLESTLVREEKGREGGGETSVPDDPRARDLGLPLNYASIVAA